jgi:hypothetical protein
MLKTMSATLYTIQDMEIGHKSISTTNELNLSNSNARHLLEKLGLNPGFEETDINLNTIEDLMRRAEVLCRSIQNEWGEEENYTRDKCVGILDQLEEARSKGATHWFMV